MIDDQVTQLRSFNRMFTQRIGALDDRFLGRNRSLGESRLLFEIGVDGVKVPELQKRLDLDSECIDRFCFSLERQGLIENIMKNPASGVRSLRLTPEGLVEVGELDRRSNEFASSLLAPLSESQRARLLSAVAEANKLMRAAAVSIQIEPPTSTVARKCLDEYFRELAERFEGGFDPSRSIPADAEELVPPVGVFLVARLDGQAVGCGALKTNERGVGEIKRMWVSRSARGLGIGRRILERLEGHARALGVRVLHLETNRTLKEAQALYRTHGYQEVEPFNDEPYAHHWFEKKLEE